MNSRPGLIDLIGPDFDRENSAPADRTLLICAAPRSGSYELCRLLIAAGVSVPHEYFNPNYANRIALRFKLAGDPLSDDRLGDYIDLLRRHRSANNIFAAKFNYRQFEKHLRNRHGAALFDGAAVIHLFRPDAAAQYESLRTALASGRWDFTDRQTTPPIPLNADTRPTQILREAEIMAAEDSCFRVLFIALGIRPIFVTSDTLFANPSAVVREIADRFGVTVDDAGLQRMIAFGKRYGDAGSKGMLLDDPPLRAALRRHVFGETNLQPAADSGKYLSLD